MERLTERKYGEIVSSKRERTQIHCSNFCNNCSQGTGNCDYVREMVEKLAEYEDAEEQGLLLRLPCKVGDTVWDVDWSLTECIVKEFEFDEAGEVYCHYDSKDGIFSAKAYLEAFGSGLFLTKEEAEQKLAEMKVE